MPTGAESLKQIIVSTLCGCVRRVKCWGIKHTKHKHKHKHIKHLKHIIESTLCGCVRKVKTGGEEGWSLVNNVNIDLF